MSSIVENNSAGGLDWNSLTSGEKYLLGMLGKPFVYWAGAVFGGTSTSSGFTLDLSNISSISLAYRGGGDTYVHFRSQLSSGTEVISSGFVGAGTPTATVEFGDAVRSTCCIQPSGSNSASIIAFTSYTTTDGKVHTANNINY